MTMVSGALRPATAVCMSLLCAVAAAESLPSPPLALEGTAEPAADCVILLHGLARTSSSMKKMQLALQQDGYIVVNDSYPSRKHTIEILAPLAIDAALQKCGEFTPTRKVNFVTHSLGSILLRYYAANNELENMARVVMLGPPNRGSAAADALSNMPGFDWINGPAGGQIGKGEDSVPLQLGPPEFEFGVIAGNRSIDPITSATLPNPDDGKVSVEDTKLPEMADFALVKVSHAYLMKNAEVIELVKNFLRHGCFDRETSRR